MPLRETIGQAGEMCRWRESAKFSMQLYSDKVWPINNPSNNSFPNSVRVVPHGAPASANGLPGGWTGNLCELERKNSVFEQAHD
jgi:hypothetical protein